jgi:hypothetical protein
MCDLRTLYFVGASTVSDILKLLVNTNSAAAAVEVLEITAPGLR